MAIEIRDSSGRQPVRLLLAKNEAAAALGIGQRTLQALMANNQIPCYFRLSKRVLFSVAALEAWIAGRVNGNRDIRPSRFLLNELPYSVAGDSIASDPANTD